MHSIGANLDTRRLVGDWGIPGDPRAVTRVDKMSMVKVYCKIETSARVDLTVNFHHGHFIDPANFSWVSEDETRGAFLLYGKTGCSGDKSNGTYFSTGKRNTF